MKIEELPDRLARSEWTRVPYVRRRTEPWHSLRRAVDAYRDWLAERRATPEAKLVAALARACIAAARDGKPFCTYGKRRGVYEHRDRLPAPLNELRRDRLRCIAKRALAEGKLQRRRTVDPGALVQP